MEVPRRLLVLEVPYVHSEVEAERLVEIGCLAVSRGELQLHKRNLGAGVRIHPEAAAPGFEQLGC